MTVLKQIVKTFNYYVFSKEKIYRWGKIHYLPKVPVDQKNILKLRKKR